jgi:hypothetical protein
MMDCDPIYILQSVVFTCDIVVVLEKSQNEVETLGSNARVVLPGTPIDNESRNLDNKNTWVADYGKNDPADVL